MFLSTSKNYFRNTSKKLCKRLISTTATISCVGLAYQYQLAETSSNSGNNQISPKNESFFGDFDEIITTYKRQFYDGETREIVGLIPDILSKVGSLDNQIVLDVGAGTGLFTPYLRSAVGDDGLVICLDIAPPFVAYLKKLTKENNWNNVAVQKCAIDSLCLPFDLKDHIDTAFLVATYHHLDQPREMFHEIYKYLKPGGRLIIIDYINENDHHNSCSSILSEENFKNNIQNEDQYRPISKGREHFKNHIPCSPQQCKKDILISGFTFEKEIMKSDLQDHFILVFKKPKFD